MFSFFMSLFLVFTISLDTFLCSLIYGTNNIKISIYKAIIISLISTLSLVLAIRGGYLLATFVGVDYLTIISFLILFLLGLYKFIEGIKKVDNKKYDQLIGIKETIVLSTTLSVDGMVAGIGIGLTEFNLIYISLFSFVLNIIFTLLGNRFGKQLAEKFIFNFTWIGGLVLIILAFTRL